MFSTVLFSLTLAPTRPHETPVSLSTSFCGSMTTSAVSLLLNFIVMLLVVSIAAVHRAFFVSNIRGQSHPRRVLSTAERNQPPTSFQLSDICGTVSSRGTSSWSRV